MKKSQRFCLPIVLVLFLLLPFEAMAAIPQSPMDAFYVNDYADVISASDQNEIMKMGTALEDACGAQVVVVTVDFFDGLDREEYGYQLFNKWGLGQKDVNNGVLLLMSIGDREIITVTGIGLEDKLPASITDRYTDDYAISYLQKNDFSTGLLRNYEALCKKVASIYGVDFDKLMAGAGNVDSANSGWGSDYSWSWGGGTQLMEIIIVIVVLLIILAVVRGIFRSVGSAPGCLFGWMLGRGTRPRRHHWHRTPPPPHMHGPRPPRNHPPGGRPTGGFGGPGMGGGPRMGGGGSARPGGGSRPSGGGPRVGGGGGTRGGGSGRKF